MQKSIFKILLLVSFSSCLSSCAHLFADDDVAEKSKDHVAEKPIKIVETQPLAKQATVSEATPDMNSKNVQSAHQEIENSLQDLKITLKNARKKSVLNHQKEPTVQLDHSSDSHHSEHESVLPEKALGWLKNGNTRFVKNRLRNDGQSKLDVEKLSKGQHPHSVIIACADSRVPPEILFDQKLGEIFVIRTAGEAIDQNDIASIEYAISHLGTKNIVVLGHTECGAVKAACNSLNGADAGSENLNHLVKDIGANLQKFKGQSFSKNYADESWAQANGVVNEIPLRSGLLALLQKEGKIKISAAMYYIDSGRVEFQ